MFQLFKINGRTKARGRGRSRVVRKGLGRMLIARKTRGPRKAPAPAKPRPPRDLAAAATKRRSRTEILALVHTMADELEGRAGTLLADPSSGVIPTEAAACQRAARHLREVIGIAQGRRSSAYWQFRPKCHHAPGG